MKQIKYIIAISTLILYTKLNIFAQTEMDSFINILPISSSKNTFPKGDYKNKDNKAALSNCPIPVYQFQSGSNIVSCNGSPLIVSMAYQDSGKIGEWMQRAVTFTIKGDVNTPTENILEVWRNSTLLMRIGIGAGSGGSPIFPQTGWSAFFGHDPSIPYKLSLFNSICSSDVIFYKWFDNANTGSFPWYVWDCVSNTVKGSGTFTGASTTTASFTNWAGTTTWNCQLCPAGSFIPSCNSSMATFFPNKAEPGTYKVTYTFDDGNGCVNSYTDSIKVNDTGNCHTLVWPGDANRDNVANNNDILAIGIGYNSTGPTRTSPTLNWVGQECTDWTKMLLNNSNYKHLDCDGNGTINYIDTTAIKQNYGLIHGLKEAEDTYINGLPELTFNFTIDTILAGGAISVPVLLGSSSVPVNNVYGIAFSINYDPSIIDTSYIGVSVNGSWLGTNGANLIYITKNFGSKGRIDVGISRTDHQNISGNGEIGALNFKIKNNIGGGTGTVYKSLKLSTSKIKSIDKIESLIQINAGWDSVIVVQNSPTEIQKQNNNDHIRIFPNPASDSFTIDTKTTNVNELKLVNIIGETVWLNTNKTGNKITIDTQFLPNGIYYLSITNIQERVIKQINIVK